jgi:putative ATPase
MHYRVVVGKYVDASGGCWPLNTRSVFALERLTDDDVRLLLIRAVERVIVEDGDGMDEDHIDASEKAALLYQNSSRPSPEPPSRRSATEDGEICSESDPPPISLFPSYPQLSRQVLATIVSLSTGDARTALSLLELALNSSTTVEEESLLSTLRKSVSNAYDRTGDDHYGERSGACNADLELTEWRQT